MARPWSTRANGLALRVRVTPRSSRVAIEGVVADPSGAPRLKLAVTAAPTDGEANAAVVALLAKTWKLPKSRFAIESGITGRAKTVAISGDPADLVQRLEAWWAAQPFDIA